MRTPILLALLAALTFSSHAQIASGYATVAIDPISNAELLPYSSLDFSSYVAGGVDFGGTINFLDLHVVSAGIDLSDTAAAGGNIWLGGFKFTAKPPRLRIKPYFKLAVGEAHLKVPQSYTNTIPSPYPVDAYVYNAALGVDYRINDFIDIRAIEVGDGRTLGAGKANPTNLLTIHTGIVFHTASAR